MKIERLSENQIRCTLNKADLNEKHLKISELAYGSQKARELFRDMIQQASAELGFEIDDTPLMVEAIPVSSDCLILIVTKVEDPEELDARFSRFSKVNEYDIDESKIIKTKAIILSMTPEERNNPDIIKASRRKRIAAGSGTSIQDVNQLLKQFDMSKEMMRRVSKNGMRGMKFPF